MKCKNLTQLRNEIVTRSKISHQKKKKIDRIPKNLIGLKSACATKR